MQQADHGSVSKAQKKKMLDGVKNIQLRRDFHSFPIYGGKEKEGTFFYGNTYSNDN